MSEEVENPMCLNVVKGGVIFLSLKQNNRVYVVSLSTKRIQATDCNAVEDTSIVAVYRSQSSPSKRMLT